MMKFQLLFLAVLLPSLLLFAQSGTTLDEYRYLSKGYEYQIEMGLDPIKGGYDLRQNFQATNGVLVIGMFKSNASHPQGLLFVIPQSTGKDVYLPLPNTDADDRVKELFQLEQQSGMLASVKAEYQLAINEYLFASIGKSDIPMAYDHPVVSTPLGSPAPSVDEQLTVKGLPITDRPVTVAMVNESPSVSSRNRVNLAVGGKLSDRQVIHQPVLQKSNGGNGKVMVKICVNKNGAVTFAKFTQRGSTTLNVTLKDLALKAARELQFVANNNVKECGVVGFEF